MSWLSVHIVNHAAKDGSYGSGVASQFVGNDPHWFGTLTAQEPSKVSFRGTLITMRLHQNVDHVTVLIHGTPQPLLLAIDSNGNLIQVPVVAEPSLSSASISAHSPGRFSTPLSDRVIGHNDSPLGEKNLHVSEAQAEAMVSPDRIAGIIWGGNDSRRTRRIASHSTSFQVSCRVDRALNRLCNTRESLMAGQMHFVSQMVHTVIYSRSVNLTE